MQTVVNKYNLIHHLLAGIRENPEKTKSEHES